MSTPGMRTRWTRALRATALAAVLGVAALVVPDSAVKPTEMELVKLRTATGVDAGARRGVDPGRRAPTPGRART